jgi:hypothetical protein
MLLFSLHDTGGFPFGATPLASGPRQAGQLFSNSLLLCAARLIHEIIARISIKAVCFI